MRAKEKDLFPLIGAVQNKVANQLFYQNLQRSRTFKLIQRGQNWIIISMKHSKNQSENREEAKLK